MAQFPFDLVGFDLDGTLLDTSRDLGVALNATLADIGRPPVPDHAVRGLIGGGSKLMLKKALDLTGGSEGHDVGALWPPLIDHYRRAIAVHTTLFPGGAAMLDALESHGARLAVVTNKLEALAVQLLDELGLSPRLACILGGDSLGPGRAKPAPDLLHAMLARTGATRAAYVGDTTYDTRAARAAGLPCVAVSFGFFDAPPHELGADAVIDHYDELVPVLRRLGA
ncbi:MAG: HAD-IA family hydrolase [Proteobacteria bacterium]|nr:HAD-IA family hydrolase [Pseudomonadota bacterium]